MVLSPLVPIDSQVRLKTWFRTKVGDRLGRLAVVALPAWLRCSFGLNRATVNDPAAVQARVGGVWTTKTIGLSRETRGRRIVTTPQVLRQTSPLAQGRWSPRLYQRTTC